MPFLIHSILLSLSIILTYIWTRYASLSSYSLQAVGILIMLYFVIRPFVSKAGRLPNALDAVVFTILTFLLVLSTGGLTSPLFFTLYFLLFVISLLFEPSQSFLMALIIGGLLIRQNGLDLNTESTINLITLILVSPIATIFGHKYLESLEKEGRITRLNQALETEETETLVWLSDKATPTLIGLIDSLSEIIGSNSLPFRFQQKLKSLHSDALNLHRSAKDLEKKIDDQSKEV